MFHQLRGPRFLPCFPVLQGSDKRKFYLGEGFRLFDVVPGPAVDGDFRPVGVPVGRDDDDFRLRGGIANGRKSIEPVAVGEIEIEETVLLAAFEELAARFRDRDEKASGKRGNAGRKGEAAGAAVVGVGAAASGDSEA